MTPPGPSPLQGTKLGVVRVRILSSGTNAGLETLMNNFFSGQGAYVVTTERLYQVIYQFEAAGAGEYTAMILFTE